MTYYKSLCFVTCLYINSIRRNCLWEYKMRILYEGVVRQLFETMYMHLILNLSCCFVWLRFSFHRSREKCLNSKRLSVQFHLISEENVRCCRLI